MLKKIISGGLTVADQAVLDAAISLGIPYGGYMPWGRIIEIGRLPSNYHIKELNTDDHLYCIERNVKESTGTLIVSAGELNDGSKFARKERIKLSHQVFVVDLELTSSSEATMIVYDWILTHNIDVIYTIGPFTFEYYNDEAVDQIISDKTLEERVRLANFDKEELWVINYSLSAFIRNQLFMEDLNKELFESCLAVSENKNLNKGTAALVIIEKFWDKLRNTFKLRVVK